MRTWPGAWVEIAAAEDRAAKAAMKMAENCILAVVVLVGGWVVKLS